MMALQKCLMEQSDIIPILNEMSFITDEEGNLHVENPPSFEVKTEDA